MVAVYHQRYVRSLEKIKFPYKNETFGEKAIAGLSAIAFFTRNIKGIMAHIKA
ncbi:hypothetical protein NUITMVRA1_17720 [Aerococcus viridans]|nr:hypothetical protein NUITMVRA1_17720 [Aerococcus viridans]